MVEVSRSEIDRVVNKFFTEERAEKLLERAETYFAGRSQAEWEEFIDLEEERLADGVPGLSVLDLPTRAFRSLSNTAGIRTVVGLEQLLEEGRRPGGLSQKSLDKVQARLQAYRQEHPRLDNQ